MKKSRLLSVFAGFMACTMLFTACAPSTPADADSDAQDSADVQTTQPDKETTGGKPAEGAASFEDAVALLDKITIPEGETVHIGYLGLSESIQYCADVTAKMKETLQPFGDQVELHVCDGRGDAALQVSQAEDLVALGMDAIIIQVIDRDACEPAINHIMDNNIHCIVLENPDATNCTSNTGYDFVAISEAQADMIAEALDGKGIVNVIDGQLGTPSSMYGLAGVEKGLAKYPDLTFGTSQAADWDRAKAMNITEDWITSGKKFDAIIALNDEMAVSAALALQAADIKGIPIVGIDGQEEAADLIRSGLMYGTIYKNPSYEGVSSAALALAAATGVEVEPVYHVPFTKVTAENVDTYKD